MSIWTKIKERNSKARVIYFKVVGAVYVLSVLITLARFIPFTNWRTGESIFSFTSLIVFVFVFVFGLLSQTPIWRRAAAVFLFFATSAVSLVAMPIFAANILFPLALLMFASALLQGAVVNPLVGSLLEPLGVHFTGGMWGSAINSGSSFVNSIYNDLYLFFVSFILVLLWGGIRRLLGKVF